MSQDHAKGVARPSQPETPHFRIPASSLVEVAMLAGGGYLPVEGRMSLGMVAMLMGKSQETVRNDMAEAHTEYRRLGSTIIVDAVDLWESLPKFTVATDPRMKHGGKKPKD